MPPIAAMKRRQQKISLHSLLASLRGPFSTSPYPLRGFASYLTELSPAISISFKYRSFERRIKSNIGGIGPIPKYALLFELDQVEGGNKLVW